MWNIAWQTGFMPGLVAFAFACVATVYHTNRNIVSFILSAGLACAFCCTDIAIRDWSGWKPVEITRRLSHVCIAVAILSPILVGMWSKFRGGKLLCALKIVLAAYCIASVTSAQNDSGKMTGILAAVLATAWMAGIVAPRADNDFAPALLLCVGAFAIGAISARTGSASLGQLSIASGAALAGQLVVRFFVRDLAIGTASSPNVVVSLLIVGFSQRFSELPLEAAWALAVIPFLPLVRFLPWIGNRTSRIVVCSLLLLGVVLGAAAYLVQKSAPPVAESKDVDPYEQFYKQ